MKLNKELSVKDVMQRNIQLLQKENAVFVDDMKEFRKTQKKLEALQNLEIVLNGRLLFYVLLLIKIKVIV